MEPEELEKLEKIKEIEEELPEERSLLKKVIILLIGLFLLLLILSYVFVSYPIGDIIQGQSESHPLMANRIELGNMSLIFENQTAQELQNIYFKEQKVEFSVCLVGKKQGSDYVINSLYQPEMFEQRFNHVSFEPCSQETVVVLHSHPYKSCIASQVDIETLKKTQQRNPDVLMVIMCEPERFSVYS